MPDNKNEENPKELDGEEILLNLEKIVQKNGYVCLPAFDQKVHNLHALFEQYLIVTIKNINFKFSECTHISVA